MSKIVEIRRTELRGVLISTSFCEEGFTTVLSADGSRLVPSGHDLFETMALCPKCYREFDCIRTDESEDARTVHSDFVNDWCQQGNATKIIHACKPLEVDA